MRRMPFRPQILPFRHYQFTRSLSTIPQTSTSAQPADKKKTRREMERFAELYHTKLDLDPFSCDWEKWQHRDFLDVHPMWYDLTTMEFFVKRVAKYYHLNTASDYLERFGGNFDSHDDFLLAFTRYPPIKVAVHQFPNDTGELYAAVWKEQDRRAAKAAKAVKTLSSP
ncbi:hypothetical protein DFH07DRAFT_1056015 [Mycena maculata]|uniref:Uncharacterized protein n=1 Tax=Mycena maculata TaxID=230809 RepID=A0AAD7NXP8_9AGAR|nr:hypothetical protein DFH07DRAFT_1056015 [Mycena maculata]